jgi:hypothetical protein
VRHGTTDRNADRITAAASGPGAPPGANRLAGQPAALGIPDRRLARVCAGGMTKRLSCRCQRQAGIRTAGAQLRRCPGVAGRTDRGHDRVLRRRARVRSPRIAGWAELRTASMRAGAWVGPMRDRRFPLPQRRDSGIDAVKAVDRLVATTPPARGSVRPPVAVWGVASGCRSLLVHCLPWQRRDRLATIPPLCGGVRLFRHDVLHASYPHLDLRRRPRPRAGIAT